MVDDFFLDFNEDVETARRLGGNGTDLVAGAGFRAAVPHFVLAVIVAPIKANVIVGPVRAWGLAPPHEDDVALFRKATGKQLLLGAEGVSADIAVFNEVFVVGRPCQPVVRQAGAELTHGCLVHDLHGGFGIQASFAKDIGHKPGTV